MIQGVCYLLLAALFMIGVWYFSKEGLDKIKIAQHQVQEQTKDEKKIESNQRELQIPKIGDDVLGDKIEGDKIVIYENISQVTPSSDYRPLDSSLRNRIIEKLKSLYEEHQVLQPQISFSYLTGNNNRKRVAKDIIDILESAGIPIEKQIYEDFLSSFSLPAIELVYHPETTHFASGFLSAIGAMFKVEIGRINLKKDPSIKRGIVVFHFYGEPRFLSDGSILLE